MQRHRLILHWKVGHCTHPFRAPHKLFPQSGHCKRGAVELHPVGQGAHRIGTVSQQIPVEQQTEAVIAIAADAGRIAPLGPYRQPEVGSSR